MTIESPPWGCSLVRLKAVACRAKDRGYCSAEASYKSHHPREASWTTREVAVPLKHGEAGATPVDAPNEDVAQWDRAPVFETGSHRYPSGSKLRSLSSSLVGTRLASPAPKPTNGRLQSWGSMPLVSTNVLLGSCLQVAKWEGVGLQNRLHVGNSFGDASRTIPTLESKPLQRSLMVKLITWSLWVQVPSLRPSTDGVTATSRSPKPLFKVQILVCALSCPDRKSLHTCLMVRQLSQKQSIAGSSPVCEQQLFQLARHE